MTTVSTRRWLTVLSAVMGLAMGTTQADARPAPDLSGAWDITASRDDGPASATLELARDGDAYTGHSGPLDAFGIFALDYRGQAAGGRLHLSIQSQGRAVGAMDLDVRGANLKGLGRLFGIPLTISGQRPPDLAAHTPQTLDAEPAQFRPLSSAWPTPLLRIYPGDTVRTRTVDAYGVDEKDQPAGMAGNPGTGPFHVEGAMPGDTIGIEIVSLKINRSTARMGRGIIDPKALPQGYPQQAGDHPQAVWLLDPVKGAAAPQEPSARLKSFTVPLRPMLGVVAVAPPGGLAVPNSDLGEWGGNLDYPQVREGVTLYLPVYQAGALIYVGDAHGRQGDGEITGQGLETSMAVEFKTVLIKRQAMTQPWAENADYVMVSGIGGSLDAAAQRATAGLATWLKQRYRLDDSDVAAVLGTALEYDIAEVVDPKSHVVAKIRKDVLSRISAVEP